MVYNEGLDTQNSHLVFFVSYPVLGKIDKAQN